MAVGTRPGIDLAKVGGDKGDLMLFTAPAGPMVMASEVGAVAGDAFARMAEGRTVQDA